MMVYKAKAYAKINLFLDITGKRNDGYHELDSVFQSVSLFDEISVELTSEGISVTCDNNELSGKDNIVYKACELFIKDISYCGGVSVHIKKNIPVAAGLGGGSADAAATLLLLNNIFSSPISEERLLELALRLGADVPFCVKGGTARVNGIGESFVSVPTPELHYVLLKERNKQSTAKMFSVIDEIGYSTDFNIDDMLAALKTANTGKIAENLFNAFSSCWEFEEMTKPFKEFSPMGVFLSGSGPTVGALFQTAYEASRCANTLIDRGYNAYYAHSVLVGVEVV